MQPVQLRGPRQYWRSGQDLARDGRIAGRRDDSQPPQRHSCRHDLPAAEALALDHPSGSTSYRPPRRERQAMVTF